MNDLIDMMVADESPADISDKIKELLMQKSAENIDIIRPIVASSMFGGPELEVETPEVVVDDDGGEDEE